MNYKEAMAYVEEVGQYGMVMGLSSMRELCARLGNPQDQLRFVHIAGTNGKGSVLAYVSTVLQKAGYRTGRYSSPAVCDYREIFQVDGRTITQSGLCKYMEQVKNAAEAMAAEGLPHPTASHTPLYQQIKDQLKDAILKEELVEGDPLPSIRAFANDLRKPGWAARRMRQM